MTCSPKLLMEKVIGCWHDQLSNQEEMSLFLLQSSYIREVVVLTEAAVFIENQNVVSENLSVSP